MAEDDIYGNKKKYENFVKNLNNITEKTKQRKYYCKNKTNLKYFKKLIRYFEVNDISFIRRNRTFDFMKFLAYYIDSDLKKLEKKDIEEIIIKVRETYSNSILPEVARSIKQIGRILFDNEPPKIYTNFKIKVDISRKMPRKDKLTYEEFEKLMNFFNKEEVMQAYLAVSFETLARPQELLYLKIKDLELQDNHAILTVSEHGKEGPKKLLCIDSFPYLMKMYKDHRENRIKEAYLFLNKHNNQLKPNAINKKIKFACNRLNINKPITCYSLKRFGVTFRRLNGDDDITIQKIAGWTSTKQMKVYDLSDQDDVFKQELAKRGLLKNVEIKNRPKTKPCPYCGVFVGFAENVCPKCNHLLDRDLIKQGIKKDEELMQFIEGLRYLKENNSEVFEAIRDMGLRKGIV